MGIRQHSKEIILVDPPPENDFCKVLFAVIEKVRMEKPCNVVIDFSRVGDRITSNGFSRLLRLRKFLVKDCGLRLVFCNVSQKIKEAIETMGFSNIFEIADSESTALEIARRPLV
jgi:anti-anti-sigma regulatory factor